MSGGFGAQHRRDRITLCFEDLALFLTLCTDDVALFVTLGLLDRRAAFTLCFEDHRSASTLGGGLLLHGLLDLLRWVDFPYLDALDANPPLVGGFIEFGSDLRVDLLSLVERIVEFHVAQHGPQRGLGEVGDSLLVVVDLKEGLLGVHHLDVDDGVCRDGGVVAGDRLLSRHVKGLCPHIERIGPGDERRDDVEARFQQLPVLAEDGQRLFLVGVDDLDGLPDHDDDDKQEQEADCSERQRPL